MLELIIFDYDGVLINSTQTGFYRFQRVARSLGLKAPTFAQLRENWGDHFETEYAPELAKKLNWPASGLELFIQKINALAPDFKAYEGMSEMLKKLAKKFQLAIISNRNRESMLRNAKRLNLDLSLFSLILAREDCLFLKPEPRVFDQVFGEVGVGPDNAIFVGAAFIQLLNFLFKSLGGNDGKTRHDQQKHNKQLLHDFTSVFFCLDRIVNVVI